MIGDADVTIAVIDRCPSHLSDGRRTIAPIGMHMEIAFKIGAPLAVFRQDTGRLRHRQKLSLTFGRDIYGWRRFYPSLDELG